MSGHRTVTPTLEGGNWQAVSDRSNTEPTLSPLDSGVWARSDPGLDVRSRPRRAKNIRFISVVERMGERAAPELSYFLYYE